jgi:beta-lactamase regulating signal transducer with metallopeptidase domain
MAAIFGARAAYWLWFLVPASQLAVLAPPPTLAEPIAATSVFLRAREMLPNVAEVVPFDGQPGIAAAALTVWLLGAIAAFAFVCRWHLLFVRRLQAVRTADGFWRSNAVVGPLVVGVWRPAIVLPANFETLYDADERNWILAHERAHQRHSDPLVNALATIWLCLSWFNPIAYWAVGRLRYDQDLACDALVLASGTSRRAYANALIKTQLAAEAATDTPIGCHWSATHPLHARIEMLRRPLANTARRRFGVAFIWLLSALASYAWWASTAHAVANPAEIARGIVISADRITESPHGGVDYQGNVTLVAAVATDLRIVASSARTVWLPVGSKISSGRLQAEVAGVGWFETERATVHLYGNVIEIKADSAHLYRLGR